MAENSKKDIRISLQKIKFNVSKKGVKSVMTPH